MEPACKPPGAPGRVHGGISEEIDLTQLVVHSQSVPWETPLGEIARMLKQLPSSYLAVTKSGKICGILWREALGLKLGGRYGYSLHAKQPVGFHVEGNCHVFHRSDSVLGVLAEALGREGRSFEADVVLLDDDDWFIGMIPTYELVKLQSRLLSWQLELSGNQRFQLERERERMERLMEQLRTQNTELHQAKDAATEASRHKSVFLSNMSHELRTPMNGVLGFLSLLEDSELDEDQKEHVGFALSSGETLLRMIDEILDFSRIETGNLQLSNASMPLLQTLKESAALLRNAARHKGLAFDLSIAPDVPATVVGDPVRLRQVLLNVIGNAVKFTLKGRVEVRCQHEPRDDGRILVRVIVRDTGIGISEEAQRRIFTPFIQADLSTTRKFGGTGLGLSVASRLVELMGGTMEVTSSPGQGSRFDIAIPFDVAPQPAVAETRMPAIENRRC